MFRKFGFINVLFLLFLVACNSPSKTEKDTLPITEQTEVSSLTVDDRITKVDILLANGFYKVALSDYERLMLDTTVSRLERAYVMEKMVNCHLNLDNLSVSDSLIKVLDSAVSYDNTIIELNHLLNKGRWLSAQGREESLVYFHEARRLAEESFRSENVLAEALTEIGAYYRNNVTHIDSAFAYMQSALPLAKEANLKERVLIELSELCFINRDYYNGLGYISEITDKTSIRYASAMKTKSRIYRKLKHFDKSKQVILETLPQVPVSDHSKRASLLEELCFTAISDNDEVLFERTINDIKRLEQESVMVNRLLGNYYFSQKEYRQAADHYQNTMDELYALSNPDIVLVKEALYILTFCYQALNDPGNAKETAFASLVYDTPYRGVDFSWDVVFEKSILNETYNFFNYNELASVVINSYESNGVQREELLKVVDLIELLDSLTIKQIKVTEETAITQFRSISRSIYHNAIKACQLLYVETRDSKYLNKAWYFIERSKSFILYKDLVSNTQQIFKNVPTDFKAKELSLKSRILSLKQDDSLDSLDLKRLTELLVEQQAYFNEMEVKYPAYHRAKFDQTIPSLEDAQNFADSTDTDLIQYYWDTNYIYTMAIEANGATDLTKIKVDSAFLNTLKAFLLHVADPSYSNVVGSYQLYQSSAYQIFQSLIPANLVDSKGILIIPDGPLHQVPFGATLTKLSENTGAIDYRKLDYWESSTTIQYAHSAKTFFTPKRKRTPSSCLLGFSYSSQASNAQNVLKEIPFSYQEVIDVKNIRQQECDKTYTGELATKDNFKQAIQSDFEVIHLATHATSSLQKLQDNKIYFKPSKTSDSLDFMYGYEVLSFDINAQLVVLSACESARGVQQKGEGAFSLARSFIQAGARNVISSFWQQVDFSANKMQTEFYTQFKSGNSIPNSLNLAKREYLKSASKINAHPSYWAGVICYSSE